METTLQVQPPSPQDLVPVADEARWQAIAERAQTEVLARLVLETRDGAESLVDSVVARILQVVPAYGSGSVSDKDLWWSVHRNLELNLLLIAERREVTAEELATRSQLGVRRAMAGIPIPDLLRAFRIGYLMLWEALTDRARAFGVDAMEALLDNTARVWTLLDRVSTGVEEAYRAYQSASDTMSRRQGLAFLSGVMALPLGEDSTAEHARRLRFDPAGPFLCAVAEGHVPAQARLFDGVLVEQPDRTVVFVQPPQDPESAEEVLAETVQRLGVSAAGIGIVGGGLAGAQSSLRCAERAHRVAAARNEIVLFRRNWFAAIACEAGDLLSPLIEPLASELAASDEAMATVRAMIDHGGNLTAAARELHVHANTVSYRLDRLRKLSGVDLRSPSGMLDAHLALMLVGRAAV